MTGGRRVAGRNSRPGLPFADGGFDIVATRHTTHHIADWEGALREMLRVLRPGGHLIYADLVVPGWLAAVGRRLLDTAAGFPTARALDAFVGRARLTPVARSHGLLRYAAVWRSSSGAPELPVPEAARQVVVDQAHRLHVGVADRRADEAEAPPAEVAAQRV